MTAAVWLAAALPVLPGVAGLVGLLLPERSRRRAAGLAVGASGLALLSSLALAWWVFARAPQSTPGGVDAATVLTRFGELSVTVGVRLDAVPALVAVAVACVAFAVQVYSTSYLAHDDRYAPYAAQVSIFTAAMMLVVVSGDLVTLLIGWEVMGLCSYLLIGHDRSLPEAPGAAVKAFLVTRVGDVGFLLGVVILGVGAGSFRISDVLAAADDGRLAAGTLTAACLLLLAGVAGKSAQFPLHTWLPDAMAGPTPISALIHAATMVAAGVYVVARLYPLFTPTALAVLGVAASITMLLGALAACAQDDIKRVLAWSTVSQLGYMTGGLAVGGYLPSLFHLLTHAAFKALLFLAAGAVIHAVATNLMSGMGGLRRAMPVTFVTMSVGLAALAGVPPFAGFWSKESVLGAAEHAALGEGAPVAAWVGWLVLVAGAATVAVTGAYVVRLWLRTFFGESRLAPDAVPHDPPPTMRWPLVALAVPSALLGFAALWSSSLPIGDFSAEAHPQLMPVLGTTVVSLALTALGGAAAWLVWRRDPATDPVLALGRARRVLAEAFYLDAVQDALVVRPVKMLAGAVRRADESLVDGAVEGTATGAVGLGRVLSRAHAAGLGRYATAVLGGAVLLAAAAVVTGEVLG
jgi:NADH-quinone oxidoreductase subunit L